MLPISEDCGPNVPQKVVRPFEPFHSAHPSNIKISVFVAFGINMGVKQTIGIAYYTTVAKYCKIKNQIKISNFD